VDPARWERLQSLFHQIVDLPEDERTVVLERECAGDPDLAERVRAMVVEDRRAGSLLDQGLASLARNTLTGVPASLHQARFGPYRIIASLGEGGMGVVYLAEREDLGSRAAIKVLRDATLSPARRERFALEQRTLAQLNHPGIARLYDADTLADGTPWFAMEVVEGESLTAWCRTRNASLIERLRLFRAVCEAVRHAHNHLVIHRDLKPSNVLVTASGQVKLLDFGIAKPLEGLDLSADRTRTGLRLMTPAYAAPEQIRGGPVGVHVDVYSLGVVLYELLAGRLPFDLADKTPGEVEALITTREPERPSVVAGKQANAPGRTAWADLDVLVLKAMHKDPDRRYATVGALIRDVDHYLAGEPLEARPDSLGYRSSKFLRRHSRAVSAAVTVLTLLVAVVAVYTVRLARARDAAVEEAARAQRIQDFTMRLFQGGDDAAGPPDSLHVVTLVDRGVQEAGGLTGDPRVQTELYLTLGEIYRKLGRLDRADSLLGVALTRRRAIFGPEHPEVAAAMVALGELRADQAKYEAAEGQIQSGLVLARRSLGPDHPQVVAATMALGRVLQERGAYDSSVAVLGPTVRALAGQGDSTPAYAAALSALAGSHFYLAHYDRSDSLNRIALAVDRHLYGPRHPAVAEDLVNLGAAQHERGNYGEAERYYRQALDITRSWYGEDHPQTAAKLTMLGRSLVYQGKTDEGVAALEQAAAIQERVYGPVHPKVASALNELGNVAVQQERYREAEARFRRIEDIYRAVYGDDHPLVALALSNRASVYMAERQYARAEPIFQDVVTRYSETLGAGHTNTAIARIKLGRVLLRQRKFAEARTESMAGYQVLVKEAASGSSFLRAARTDLAIASDSLRQPEEAARFRKELADTVHYTP
jgi:eukaryotic-like serine/threonine-protein kinase